MFVLLFTVDAVYAFSFNHPEERSTKKCPAVSDDQPKLKERGSFNVSEANVANTERLSSGRRRYHAERTDIMRSPGVRVNSKDGEPTLSRRKQNPNQVIRLPQ